MGADGGVAAGSANAMSAHAAAAGGVALQVRVIGCHAFGADPWRLIEVHILGSCGPIDLAAWALPVPGEPRENWQAPYDEHLRTAAGWVRWELNGGLDLPANHALHFCFWLNMIADGPLLTPWGAVPIPTPTALPEHLASLAFEEP